MKKTVLQVLALVVTIAATSACATKGYVNEGLAEVNQKVETLSQSLEETQEATRENAQGVTTARREAAAAGDSAAAAGRSADEAGRSAADAGDRADAVGRETERLMRLLYEVVLSQDQGDFKFGDAELPDGARDEIDRLASQLKSDAPKNVYIEIEGHTDATGEVTVNERLGLERAEAVKRYLHESHQIPLHRMNTISYGEEKPVAPNDTREGRAQNRRVVVRVLT
jgi:outer membrane protein OmpA-like peptidoglycan-associated protein